MKTLTKEGGVWSVRTMASLFGFFLLVGFVGACMIPIMPNWTKENMPSLNEIAFAGFIACAGLIVVVAGFLWIAHSFGEA